MRKIYLSVMFILIISALASSSGVNGAEFISLDSKNTDIRELLTGLAKANKINLILGSSVEGNVTVSMSNISPLEAMKSILSANGFAMEKIGDLVMAGKPEEIQKLLVRSSKIIPLKNALAADVQKALTAVASSYNAQVESDSRTNTIVVVGTEASLLEIEQTIKVLDVPKVVPTKPPAATRTFTFKYAQASAVQATITKLLSPASKILVDDRTNTLVIVTDEPDALEQAAKIIEKLDVVAIDKEQAKLQELQTQIFTLNHVDANAIEEILKEMLSPNGKIKTFVKQKESIVPVSFMTKGEEQTISAGSATTAMARQKWSDTLIITDTKSVLDKISELIGKLDVKTLQVFIEAKIVEVNTSGTSQLGIDWNAKESSTGSNAEGKFSLSKIPELTVNIGTLSNKYLEDIMIKLKALETRGLAKLISNPSIYTLDNELAQMVVADRIPIPTILISQLTTTTSYEFINVGILLTVIPHIAEDGTIIMDAMPEVDSIKEWTPGASPQPIISSRLAHSRVRIKDGETFVIGGLMRDEQRKTSSHVPLLGRIPLLGRLFGAKSSDNSKSELMVFITPKIVKEK